MWCLPKKGKLMRMFGSERRRDASALISLFCCLFFLFLILRSIKGNEQKKMLIKNLLLCGFKHTAPNNLAKCLMGNEGKALKWLCGSQFANFREKKYSSSEWSKLILLHENDNTAIKGSELHPFKSQTNDSLFNVWSDFPLLNLLVCSMNWRLLNIIEKYQPENIFGWNVVDWFSSWFDCWWKGTLIASCYWGRRRRRRLELFHFRSGKFRLQNICFCGFHSTIRSKSVINMNFSPARSFLVFLFIQYRCISVQFRFYCTSNRRRIEKRRKKSLRDHTTSTKPKRVMHIFCTCTSTTFFVSGFVGKCVN